MSLLAWYKLDGNANDSSGNGYNGTASNVSWVTGKLVQAGSFNGTNSYLNTSITPDKIKWFSFSLWINPTAFPITDTDIPVRLITARRANGSTLWSAGISVAKTLRLMAWNGTTHLYANGSNVLSLSTFYHIAGTYDGSIFKIYLNGVLETSLTITIASEYYDTIYVGNFDNNVSSRPFNGLLDDIHIYNHVLSLKEIKQLSKANILHYDFDTFQEPTVNVVTNTDLDTGWSKGYCSNILWNDVLPPSGVNSQVVSFTDINTDGYGYWYCYGDYAPQTPSTTYTISIYARTIGSSWSFRAYTADNSEIGRQITNIVTVPGDGLWYRVVFNPIFNPADSQSNSLSFEFTTIPVNQRCWLCAPQMEAKSYATPFVIGSRTGIVLDSSGYEYDAPLQTETTPQWYKDGVGEGCYRFNGTTQYIQTNLTSTELSSLTTASISFWRKSTALASWLPFMGQGYTEYIMATSGGTGAFYHSNVAGTKTIYVDGAVSTTPSTELTTWHHYVITDVNLSLWTAFKIGGYSTGEWLLEGDYDDVRIYNTVLTQSDVTELYQTKANLDNVGNLFVRNISLPSDITTGLTNYWTFDTNGNDSVGGNNGTVTGATLTTGIISGAYSFNGSSNYITLASTINLNSNANWTVILWVKTTDDNSSFLSNSSGGPVYSDFSMIAGKITYYHYNGTWLAKSGTISINTGNWTMLTWINRSNGTMDMYVDEILDYGNFSSTLSSAGAVNQIGKNWTTNYFSGLMDDFRIYNRCLSPSEIKLLYTRGFR